MNGQSAIGNRQSAIGNKTASKRIALYIFHFSLFTFCVVSSFAQQASATVDREKILLGEQIILQLKLEDFNPRTSFIVSWFHVPDTINHIEVVKRQAVDTIDVGGLTTYVQEITITSFDSGKWQLPPLILTAQDKASGAQTQIKASDISIEVLPVDVSNLAGYHDIKDIIEVKVQNNPWIIGIIALVTLLSVIALIRLMRKKQKAVIVAKPLLRGTPLERAMEKIEVLQKENLPAKKQTKLFYSKLDVICRDFLEEEFHIHALQSTSDELMIQLSVYLQQESMRTKFYQLLRLSDAVKFAKYIPAEDQNKEAVHTAIKSLQNFDDLMQHIN